VADGIGWWPDEARAATTPGPVRSVTALPNGWDDGGLSADQEQHVIRVLFELLDQFLVEREPKAGPT
jgi:hypothetical protein